MHRHDAPEKSFIPVETDLDLAVRAAWLSYVGGHTQEQIAARLGISRIKVTRLIARAQKEGLVHVFVEGRAARWVALEDALTARYDLAAFVVTPTLGEDDLPLRALGNAGARLLQGALERPEIQVVGMGHGRTLASVVEHLPRIPRRRVRFVSLLGSLTRSAAANPFDVIHRLAERAGGEAYFMPAPFFCNSVADREVLLAQKSLQDVFALARCASFMMIGIGTVAEDAHLLQTGMITGEELAELRAAGAVGEVLGTFVDDAGVPVDVDVNRRSIAVGFDDLKGKEVVAIAGGHGKVGAVDAVLRSGIARILVTDEQTAEGLLKRTQKREGLAAE